jgi:hypothetical protein
MIPGCVLLCGSPCRLDRLQILSNWESPVLRQKSQEEAIVEKQDLQRKHKVIQESVVRRQNNTDLEWCNNPETQDAEAARQDHQPNKEQFDEECGEGGCGMKLVRKLLRIPAQPGGQRTILIVVVQGGEMAPPRIASEVFGKTGLEIDG